MYKYIVLSLILLLLLSACTQESPVIIETTQAIIESDPIETKTSSGPDNTYTPSSYSKATVFLDQILSGGVPPDGIPPIDEPQFLTLEEAEGLYSDADQMFLVVLEDQTYIYPQSILVWHEIVNMEDYGVSVTYCPLTGSCITYEFPDHLDTTLGTSGKLLNSNLVMYDRYTGAYIPQIDGIGINDQLENYQLGTRPTYWIDFATVKAFHEDALILSDTTGYFRNYEQDPYGSYTEEGPRNYYQDEGTLFPVMNKDNVYDISDKEMILGIKHEGSTVAIRKSAVSKNDPLSFLINDQEMTAIYDPSIDNIRVFHGSVASLDENLSTAISPVHFEVMWFAWYAFYPETEVIE